MESVRRAEPIDVRRITELAQSARDEVAPQRGGPMFLAALPTGSDLELRVGERVASGTVVVGTIDDVVVGFAIAHGVERGAIGAVGVVEALYVEPEARAVGVGEAIVGELGAVAAEHSWVGLDAYALPGDRATKNFFEGAGFKARLLVMHRSSEGA